MRYVPFALLLVASTVHAETWLQVSELDKKGSVLLVETTGIDRTVDLRKAPFKSVYTDDRPIPDGYRHVAADAKSYRWELDQGQFNCKDRTLAVSQSALHGADDEVVATVAVDPAALKFRQVPPQSFGGLLLQQVCANPPPDGGPQLPLARLTRPANPDDFYPANSRRRGEEGAPVVKVCVGPSGEILREPEITDTSGFPDIDGAAVRVAKATHYAAAIENGAAAAESCIRYKVKFTRLNH